MIRVIGSKTLNRQLYLRVSMKIPGIIDPNNGVYVWTFDVFIATRRSVVLDLCHEQPPLAYY